MHQETDHHEDLHLRFFIERGRSRREILEKRFEPEVVDYIRQFADPADPGTEMFMTTEYFNIEVVNSNTVHTIVNLKRLNDIALPNDFLSFVNRKLPPGGYFIGCLETQRLRRKRILSKYPKVIAYPMYCIDFIIKRLFPKLAITRRIYRLLTRGINRVMSMTEALGRLVACGYEIVDVRDIGYLTYFVGRKVGPPADRGSLNMGILIRLRRVGQGGRLFNVLKLRTMHPYAEYLQDYVHEKNSFTEGCKFRDDFRVTSWGHILRRIWIDELPMLINWARGQMKLVGVRPLSEHFFGLYPEEFRQRRIKYKPGLVPPFYVDMPVTFDEVIESERRYLDAYDRNPYLTDFKYFWRAIYNIVIRRVRSA